MELPIVPKKKVVEHVHKFSEIEVTTLTYIVEVAKLYLIDSSSSSSSKDIISFASVTNKGFGTSIKESFLNLLIPLTLHLNLLRTKLRH